MKRKDFIMIFGIPLIVMLIMFLLLGVLSCTQKTYKVGYELVNLGDYEGIKGAFFLGCGQIGTELYYIGYIRIDEGIKRIKIHNSATIHYTQKTPKIGVIYESWHEPYLEKDLDRIETRRGDNTQIHIYIPEGSIKENYSLGE